MGRTVHTKQYADRVAAQAAGSHEDPLYSGDHLSLVAEYLSSTHHSGSKARAYRPGASEAFAWQYCLRPQDDLKARGFIAEHEYQKAAAEEGDTHPKLVFLAGLPTPRWANTIGNVHDMDPLLLGEYLNFLPSVKAENYALPAIPSPSRNVIRLTIPTIGYAEPKVDMTTEELQGARRLCSKDLKTHLRTIRTACAGSSIVRRFYLHDANRFTCEQEISMTLAGKGTEWTVLAWSDAGNDDVCLKLPVSEVPAFMDRDLKLVPIIQESRRRLWHAARPTFRTSKSSSSEKTLVPRPSQTIALVPQHYGKMMNTDLAAQDPFYAISELFELAAAAEAQFINLMSARISDDIERAGAEERGHDTPNLKDFQYHRDILDLHGLRLEEVIQTISYRSKLPWPTSTEPSLTSVAEESRESLLASHEYLLERIKVLKYQCERGANLVLDQAHLSIAQQSFGHNRELGRLTELGTWVAILYVPLSFVNSIFGMNMAEFGSGNKPMWIWAAIVVPMIALSLTGLLWRVRFERLFRFSRK